MAAVEEREPLLVAAQLTKTFGAVQALKGVDLTVSAGEVVALVGDNGAGKSTLVKTLAGAHQPDTGQIFFQRSPVALDNPAASVELGIATIYQDLALCDHLDVVANLYLGRELRKGKVLDEVEMERSSWELLRQLSAKIPSVRIPVASLSGGQRQTVAIAVKQPVPLKVDLTIDFKRFGVPVDVHAPATDETADAADLSGG